MSKLSALLVVTLLAVSTSATAEILNFRIEGVGSGTLNGVAFNNSSYRIDMQADTAAFGQSGMNSYDPLQNVRITIAGQTMSFDIPTRLGQFSAGIYFSRAGNNSADLLDFYLAQPVDMRQAFGPVTGSSVFGLDQFVDVPTSQGNLSLEQSGNVRFQAIAVVPEPESWAMLGAGLGVLAWGLRRRRAAA